MSEPGGSRVRGWDGAAVLLLALLPAWVFRDHVLGTHVYFGNPDRLNAHLKILRHYVDSLSESGRVAAWCWTEMGGYDSFSLPYVYPSPLAWVVALLGPEALYVTAGYVSLALLSSAGIVTYVVLRERFSDPLACLCGAVVYQLCDLSLLKVSQNDLSFSVLLVIPLGILVLRRADWPLQWRFAAMSTLLFSLFHFMFLQKAAYALLLFGAYASYLAVANRRLDELLLIASSGGVALLGAAARVAQVGLATSLYVRKRPGSDLSSFEGVYEFQNIRPYEILRWIDGGIFGRSRVEAAELGNNINLSEGFLLYAGTAATLAAIVGLLAAWRRWPLGQGERSDDSRFFGWVLITCISVVLVKPVLWLVYELFLEMDFTHARVLVIAVFPFALLVAAGISTLRAQLPVRRIALAAGCGMGVGLAWWLGAGTSHLQGVTEWLGMQVRMGALVQAGWVAVVFILAVAGIRRLTPSIGQLLAGLVCGLLVGQSLFWAQEQILHARATPESLPFDRGDYYAAPADSFHFPSEARAAFLSRALESAAYRSVVVCDRVSGGGLCAAHMGSFWGLRLGDGYYGIGVPRRIAALPWPEGLSLRSLSFSDLERIPWDILALLNVKYAMTVSPAWYSNEFSGLPPAPRVTPNPVVPTERAFFTSEIRIVATADAAADRLLSAETELADVSWVEGGSARSGMPRGAVESVEQGYDALTIHFAPSSEARFLVVNELHYPGWEAWVDGDAAPIRATNAFMRGVDVPPGTRRVEMRFAPLTRRWPGLLSYASASVLLVFGWLWYARSGRGCPSRPSCTHAPDPPETQPTSERS